MKKHGKEHENNVVENLELEENAVDIKIDSLNEQSEHNEELINEESSEKSKLKELKEKLKEKTKQCDEYMNLLQRKTAEFDNFRKRTIKEKECIYSDAVCEVVQAFLPVVDNFERAIQSLAKDDEVKNLKAGIELVFKQLKDAIKNLGVEEIVCANEKFNPDLHNAVMHVKDEQSGENTVLEEFQKGYVLKDKVIRHSMVKVAN